MIVCSNCGTANADTARFCVNCGDFLEWSETRADEAAVPRSGQDPQDAPKPPATEPERPSGATGRGVDDQPAPVQPVVHAPPRARPRPPRPEPVRRDGDDWWCAKCGAGNEERANFCRACGERRAVTVAARPHRPWWRRLRDRLPLRRRAQTEQRRRQQASRRLLLIIALLCLLTVAVVAGPPLVGRLVDEVRDRTQDHVPLNPDAVTASSQLRDHPAANIADGVTNRFWAPAGDGRDSWVQVRYATPVRVLDIVVTAGISTEQELFLTVGRPAELAVTATRVDGSTVERTLSLKDQPGEQHFSFEAADVVSLRLVVRSAYGPTSRPGVAIGEVEFFGRR